MSELKKSRYVGADLVRCVACLSVISVHFFLNSGFYNEPMRGGVMFTALLMRSFFMICVPMFIMLTGYLMSRKKLEKSYYFKAKKTIFVYVLASLACVAYKLIAKVETNPGASFASILTYTAAPYGWYVEMYFGLFLLIPFLNIMYNGLPSQRSKQALLLTMLATTALPLVVNVYNFSSLSWWAQPDSSAVYARLMPRWWAGIYPLTYYFLGAYIREYGLKLSLAANRAAIPLMTLVNALYCYWRCGGGAFIWGPWIDWGSALNVALAVLVFRLLVSKDYARVPGFVAKGLSFVADISLGIYLCSYIFDNYLYKKLNESVSSMPARLPYFFLIVLAVFIGAAVVSAAIEYLYRVFDIVWKLIKDSARRKKEADTAR